MNLEALGIDSKWEQSLLDVFDKYSINTLNRQACFIGQCMHESGGFKLLEENLHYSSGALMRTWPSRFPDQDTADKFANNPEKIANKVYGGRMGNVEDGDGWKYHGRGLIQLTGKDNYANCGSGLGVDLLSNPEWVATPEYASLSAGWFWNKKGLNELADVMDIETMTKRINGGTLGLDDRLNKIQRIMDILNT